MKSTESSLSDGHKSNGLRNGRQFSDGRRAARENDPAEEQLRGLLSTLTAAANGDFSARVLLDGYGGVMRQIAQKFNRMVELNEALTNEIMRVERVVRREGRPLDGALDAASDDRHLPGRRTGRERHRLLRAHGPRR